MTSPNRNLKISHNMVNSHKNHFLNKLTVCKRKKDVRVINHHTTINMKKKKMQSHYCMLFLLWFHLLYHALIFSVGSWIQSGSSSILYDHKQHLPKPTWFGLVYNSVLKFVYAFFLDMHVSIHHMCFFFFFVKIDLQEPGVLRIIHTAIPMLSDLQLTRAQMKLFAQTRLQHLAKIEKVKLNHQLIIALVEQWRLEINSLHLNSGETSIIS